MSASPISTYSVLIVDDQQVCRLGLKAVFSPLKQYSVVGEAENGEVAKGLILQHNPDIVMLDIHMPVMDGISTIHWIKTHQPTTKVLMFTVLDDETSLKQALSVGADGYCTKTIAMPELERALDTVLAGNLYLDPQIAGKLVASVAPTPIASPTVPPPSSTPPTTPPGGGKPISTESLIESCMEEILTLREVEILRLVSCGKSTEEIATETRLRREWVNGHLENILSKLAHSKPAQHENLINRVKAAKRLA